MRKTLYISDLDGTLLNTNGVMSKYTKETISQLQNKGILISCATGRSLASVRNLWNQLPLKCPVAIGNGVSIYNLVDQRYLHLEVVPPTVYRLLDRLLKQYDCHAFLYAIKDEQEWMLYESIERQTDRDYYVARFNNYENRCAHCTSIAELPFGFSLLYVTLYGEYEKLKGVEKQLQTIPEIHGLYSQRADDPLFYLDIVSANCSKSSAMNYIKLITGADEIVAFGDHMNDMDMLMAADRAYVPSNAIPQIKSIATKVLPHCNEDCVARFIEADVIDLF